MDTQTLQKLFELFAQLGSQGQTAFIAWLAFKAFEDLVIGASVAGTVITVVMLIVRSVARYFSNEATLREIGKLVGVNFWEAGPDEQRKVLHAVGLLAKR